MPKGKAGESSPEKMTVPNETAVMMVRSPIVPPVIRFKTRRFAAGLECAIVATFYEIAEYDNIFAELCNTTSILKRSVRLKL